MRDRAGADPGAHSVRSHLRLEVAEYDDAVRRFIPGYEGLLGRTAAEALASSPEVVLDVGAGTGALAQAVLERSSSVWVVLLDVDPEMLALARGRLAPWADRVTYVQGSFLDPLPPCDAAVSSLVLHHTPSMEVRTAAYRRVAEALRPGGIFVNADVTLPAAPGNRSALYLAWVDHLILEGIPPARAWQHFVEWAGEDTYFPVGEEMAAMKEAGLQAELVWRDRVVTVVVGRRGG